MRTDLLSKSSDPTFCTLPSLMAMEVQNAQITVTRKLGKPFSAVQLTM